MMELSSSAEVKNMRNDWQKNAKALFDSTLAKFDLVSRDEYESQTEILRNSRQKLEELEQVIDRLTVYIEKRESETKKPQGNSWNRCDAI